MKFTKMQGAGNDYVYIDAFANKIDDPAELSRRISDRHFGVGSDGLVLIMPSETCDFRMRMFNADGSEAEMCGNASRCVAKFVYDNKMTSATEITLETLAGVKTIKVHVGEDGKVDKATVDMGAPVLEAAKVPAISSSERIINEETELAGSKYNITCVSMGNPHCVIFTDENVEGLELEKVGPAIETAAIFPRKTNVEFVNVVSDTELKMRVWERGSGETLACGTGACATLVAAVLNNRSSRKADLVLKGGTLTVEWDEATGHVLMTGPAVAVFEGELFNI